MGEVEEGRFAGSPGGDAELFDGGHVDEDEPGVGGGHGEGEEGEEGGAAGGTRGSEVRSGRLVLR